LFFHLLKCLMVKGLFEKSLMINGFIFCIFYYLAKVYSSLCDPFQILLSGNA